MDVQNNLEMSLTKSKITCLTLHNPFGNTVLVTQKIPFPFAFLETLSSPELSGGGESKLISRGMAPAACGDIGLSSGTGSESAGRRIEQEPVSRLRAFHPHSRRLILTGFACQHSLGSMASPGDNVQLAEVSGVFVCCAAESGPLSKKGSVELNGRNGANSSVKGCSKQLSRCCSEASPLPKHAGRLRSPLGEEKPRVHVCLVGNE